MNYGHPTHVGGLYAIVANKVTSRRSICFCFLYINAHVSARIGEYWAESVLRPIYRGAILITVITFFNALHVATLL